MFKCASSLRTLQYVQLSTVQLRGKGLLLTDSIILYNAGRVCQLWVHLKEPYLCFLSLSQETEREKGGNYQEKEAKVSVVFSGDICWKGWIRNTDKKSYLTWKEIRNGAVAKSYVRKGFLIYEEMRKYLVIYEDWGGR